MSHQALPIAPLTPHRSHRPTSADRTTRTVVIAVGSALGGLVLMIAMPFLLQLVAAVMFVTYVSTDPGVSQQTSLVATPKERAAPSGVELLDQVRLTGCGADGPRTAEALGVARNTSSESRSYRVTITSTDPTGAELGRALVGVRGLAPGATTTFSVDVPVDADGGPLSRCDIAAVELVEGYR